MPGRVLVAGWSSFLHGEATAGDVASMHTAAAWLAAAGVAHDLAWSPALAAAWGGVELDACDPAAYTHLLFVCGPLAGWQVEELCDRFAGATRVAVGVSVVAGGAHDRFDTVIARDGVALAPTADLAALPPPRRPWPVAVRIFANPQPEYGERSRHDQVHATITAALDIASVAVVVADTRLDPREPARRDGAALDGLLRAADLVVTTRLHGMVLALRAGTPVVAVDPIAGGAKVTAQAAALRWPQVLAADGLTTAQVLGAVEWCSSAAAGAAVAAAATAATASAASVRARALVALGLPGASGRPGSTTTA
ncbi:MAG TPA: polysaccharide pyruvyl transferase family protein [Acidimicrobiales bacterium]|nr:polysaccharide pyruvyl transferase family protein [Acidimicrobiales bacterium]